MLGHDPFYHGGLKNAILAFGTLFNDVRVKRVSSDASREQVIKVPISFVSRDRMLSRVQEFQDQDAAVPAITLPRMSFDLSGEYSYDGQRALNRGMKKYNRLAGTATDVAFTPVPWQVGFELSILTLSQEDAIQIIEQILPFFKPDFTVTMNAQLGDKQDISFSIQGVNSNLEVTGNFESRNIIEYTINFIASIWLYGPVSNSGLIKKVIVETTVPPSAVITQTIEPDYYDASDDDTVDSSVTTDTEYKDNIFDEDYNFSETTIELL